MDDSMMIACQAAFDVERIQCLSRGKTLTDTEEHRAIYRLGFCAGATWTIDEVKKGGTNGSEQPAPLAARVPVPRVPVAAPPGPGVKLLNEHARAEPGPATEHVPMAAGNPRQPARARRYRPLQPRRP